MRIAITGTIGSGKSTVSNYLRNKGYYVFSADDSNRALLEEGNEGYYRVKEAFPECFDGNALNKSELSSVAFSDKKKKAILEQLLHPLILIDMYRQEIGKKVFFAEIPLLFETGFDSLFDESLLIVTTEEIAIERLTNKGYSKDEAIARIKAQMSVEDKLQRADRIIYNITNIEDLYHQVDMYLEDINAR